MTTIMEKFWWAFMLPSGISQSVLPYGSERLQYSESQEKIRRENHG
jgi:hypothetical protein